MRLQGPEWCRFSLAVLSHRETHTHTHTPLFFFLSFSLSADSKATKCVQRCIVVATIKPQSYLNYLTHSPPHSQRQQSPSGSSGSGGSSSSGSARQWLTQPPPPSLPSPNRLTLPANPSRPSSSSGHIHLICLLTAWRGPPRRSQRSRPHTPHPQRPASAPPEVHIGASTRRLPACPMQAQAHQL
jgi:hypothetical protein